MNWILIFLCLPAFGQLPVLPFAPALQSSVPGPTSISGLGYYWVSSDLTVGATVTNWVDRIQSAVWTNSGSLQPTNSASGVCFDGSKTLTNNVLFSFAGSNNYKLWIVMKNVRNTTVENFYNQLGTANNSGQAFGGGNVIDPVSQAPRFIAITNIIQDWLVCGTGNNVLTTTRTNNISTGYAGVLTASGNNLLASFASTANGNARGFFYVVEVAWFTNDITSVQADTLHKYATNTYNFSP